MNSKNKLAVKFIGAFWLLFGGCGGTVLAAMFIADDRDSSIVSLHRAPGKGPAHGGTIVNVKDDWKTIFPSL
jgi:hypothetical protein